MKKHLALLLLMLGLFIAPALIGDASAGHIPTALNIPVAGFAARSGSLDKKKQIVVYCNYGGRSYNAYRKLQKLGYDNIRQAIFADWKEAGLPVEK